MAKAAQRELFEETSLRCDTFSFANLINDNGPDRHYIQVGFIAHSVAGDVQLMEPEFCYEWSWFPLSGLPENIFFGHHKQIRSFVLHGSFDEETA